MGHAKCGNVEINKSQNSGGSVEQRRGMNRNGGLRADGCSVIGGRDVTATLWWRRSDGQRVIGDGKQEAEGRRQKRERRRSRRRESRKSEV